jgi:hypothetical protein
MNFPWILALITLGMDFVLAVFFHLLYSEKRRKRSRRRSRQATVAKPVFVGRPSTSRTDATFLTNGSAKARAAF